MRISDRVSAKSRSFYDRILKKYHVAGTLQEPNLSIHPMSWKLLPENKINSIFYHAVADAILGSKWRTRRNKCFCDLVLHIMQQAMSSVLDITVDGPTGKAQLLRVLNVLFTSTIVQAIEGEMQVVARMVDASAADTNRFVASET